LALRRLGKRSIATRVGLPVAFQHHVAAAAHQVLAAEGLDLAAGAAAM
jgi:hypothetical protein